ncbi:MAG: hybrid sensor histidine kinase/response regulator [Thermoanaerobaculia bacterium]|nr:hybrid sensor histidine kinase/response regulator [Thermoanaerobaculia bacterium]
MEPENAESASPPLAGRGSGSVLVVDDDPLNRMLLAASLEESGYEMTGAENGAEALEILRRQPFDTVLLDLIMPEMDGFEVLARMKDDNTLRHIPVIVISAVDELDSVVRCIEMGATDYLAKPFDPVLLRARLNASLASKRMLDLERAYAKELLERNQELDAFAHTVAHDLKNPLGALIGYAEMAIDDFGCTPGDEQLDSLRRILQCGTKMKSIVDELLLLAGVRKQEVSCTRLDMGSITREACQRLRHLWDGSPVAIAEPGHWPAALGYGPWVEEVWVNYVSNAFKYGGQPPRIELGADELPAGMVRFWVKDNGPGLSPDERARLFVPFTRLNQANLKGHGLGLSIVRRIVEKLGGKAGVESDGKTGSTFYFTLPGTA